MSKITRSLPYLSLATLLASFIYAQAVGGSGTAGTISKWVTSTELGDSAIAEAGGNVAIGQPPGTNAKFRVSYHPDDRNAATSMYATLAPSADPNGVTTGSAVKGVATNSSGTTQGVWGATYSNTGTGVIGSAVSTDGETFGVKGSSESPSGTGVQGTAKSTEGVNYGVVGVSNSPNGYAGFFSNPGGHAAHFEGTVHVAGNLSKASGSFKIDHPLDPENKYLSHSFVESPDMMNIYNGIVTLGGDGAAEVTLPAWFEALNREFRYQLTCLGGFAPVYVARKVSGNRFKIAGGRRGMEVSWQLTGVRRDAFAEKHRIRVEEAKPAEERGSYLHPEAFGKPAEKGVKWARGPQSASENLVMSPAGAQ